MALVLSPLSSGSVTVPAGVGTVISTPSGVTIDP
jgi:hypothetical protein